MTNCSVHTCNICGYVSIGFHLYLASILRAVVTLSIFQSSLIPARGEEKGTWVGVWETGAQGRESTPGSRRETSDDVSRSLRTQFWEENHEDRSISKEPTFRWGLLREGRHPASFRGLFAGTRGMPVAVYSAQVPSVFPGVCWTFTKQLWANKCHLYFFVQTGFYTHFHLCLKVRVNHASSRKIILCIVLFSRCCMCDSFSVSLFTNLFGAVPRKPRISSFSNP